ncbi:MAG: Transcriptional regulatory protein terminal [Actinomycetota bacterium]|jgi:DNA-binding response OmpR family regulator
MDALWVDKGAGRAGIGAETLRLTPSELSVLAVLADAGGRVVPRTELARSAGLVGMSARRCEAALVGVRHALGPDVVVNVRGRGWRLAMPATAS